MPRYLLLIDDVRTIDADIPLELTVADEFEHEGRWWRVSALRDDVDVEAGARAVAVEGALPRYFVFGSRLAEVDLYWPHLSVANVCTFYGDVPPSVPRAGGAPLPPNELVNRIRDEYKEGGPIAALQNAIRIIEAYLGRGQRAAA
jgi:hypothetical protein